MILLLTIWGVFWNNDAQKYFDRPEDDNVWKTKILMNLVKNSSKYLKCEYKEVFGDFLKPTTWQSMAHNPNLSLIFVNKDLLEHSHVY